MITGPLKVWKTWRAPAAARCRRAWTGTIGGVEDGNELSVLLVPISFLVWNFHSSILFLPLPRMPQTCNSISSDSSQVLGLQACTPTLPQSLRIWLVYTCCNELPYEISQAFLHNWQKYLFIKLSNKFKMFRFYGRPDSFSRICHASISFLILKLYSASGNKALTQISLYFKIFFSVAPIWSL